MIPGLDAREVTPEFKLKLKFYCSWTCWVFFVCFIFRFFSPCFFFFVVVVVCLFCSCGFSIFISILITFFFSILSSLSSSSSHPHSHHFTLLPSTVVKSIALLPNNSFCPFSFTLFSCPHLPLLFSSNLSPDYPSLHHTRHPLANLLYQFYTIPNPCKP
jgi:hypothetical protein